MLGATAAAYLVTTQAACGRPGEEEEKNGKTVETSTQKQTHVKEDNSDKIVAKWNSDGLKPAENDSNDCGDAVVSGKSARKDIVEDINADNKKLTEHSKFVDHSLELEGKQRRVERIGGQGQGRGQRC